MTERYHQRGGVGSPWIPELQIMDNQGKTCGSSCGKRVACWLFCIAHIAALTCIATALWQIWHVMKDGSGA